MDLSELATLLRESGDQILNGSSKLSLSTKLLKDLNESFNLIVEEKEALSSTFQVVGTSSSKVQLLLDLQFLHDFIQRTVGLKLTEYLSDPCDNVSLVKFKNLKLLEIHKVPLSKIIGLLTLRNQLQYLSCIKCLTNLKELFIFCGGDKGKAYIWNELKEAILSYNNLETIDNSFEYVPWLQMLDLSHNLLNNAQAIDCLPYLKHLNLGFNYLETVPIFKKESFRNLQILILKSNFIGDLVGLLYLDNLVTLDLSCNYLIDHKSLSPLSHLAALQWLNLEGNPLSFHPHHRNITSRYLHLNTVTVKFILDRIPLSKSEKKLIGTHHPDQIVNYDGFHRIHQSSVCSNISEMSTNSDVTAIATSELTRSQSTDKKKIRKVVISDKEENDARDGTGNIVDPGSLKNTASVSTNITDDDALTQQKIEKLRDKYGEDWLKFQNELIMQDILGMEKTEIKSSTPFEEDFMVHAADVFNNKFSNNVDNIQNEVEKSDAVSELSANNTFITASESSDIEENEIISESTSLCSEEDEHLEDEENEHPYIAQVIHEKLEPDEIFLVISDKYFKERDTINGRVKYKWFLEIIESCEIISSNPTIVQIKFDTVRRNMKERKYILEDNEGQKFFEEIKKILSQRPLDSLNQIVYCCMKCLTQFSREKDRFLSKTDGPLECPNPSCKSTLVYEMDDIPTPTNNQTIIDQTNKNLQRSLSECSIASETEEKPLAQIHVTAEVHMDSNESTSVTTNCSAASVRELDNSHLSTDNILKKYESDIEIISNPSLSSIEVLEEHMRPGRKRSSEERRTLMQPTLVTIPDIVTPVSTNSNFPLQSLTESSSSSSVTESVCTAYDAQQTTPLINDLEVHSVVKEATADIKDEEKNKSGLFTSLIEGLFSSPTTGKKTIEETDVTFPFSEDFSAVDHRVKYYLYQNIFEDENENFVWLLRCVLLGSILPQPTQGCLVLSTNKIYILHINEHEVGDDLSSWLVKKDSYTIDKLKVLYTLYWKQGVGIKIKKSSKKCIHYLCILQDMQRTTNFIAYLSNNFLPKTCDLVSTVPESSILTLKQIFTGTKTNDDPENQIISLLSVFNEGVLTCIDSKTVTLGVFLMTSHDIYILSDFNWFLPNSDKIPSLYGSQPISNLIELDLNNLSLTFHFLDEMVGCEELWTITWETLDSLNTVISAIKTPWEELFSIPIQINYDVH